MMMIDGCIAGFDLRVWVVSVPLWLLFVVCVINLCQINRVSV